MYFFGSDTHPAYNEDPGITSYVAGIGNFTIGRGWGGAGFGGRIDDVIMWNRALTAAEVNEVYGQADPVCQYVCGDSIIDPDETCDDGNAVGGDGCSETCQWDGSGCEPIFFPGTYLANSDCR